MVDRREIHTSQLPPRYEPLYGNGMYMTSSMPSSIGIGQLLMPPQNLIPVLPTSMQVCKSMQPISSEWWRTLNKWFNHMLGSSAASPYLSSIARTFSLSDYKPKQKAKIEM